MPSFLPIPQWFNFDIQQPHFVGVSTFKSIVVWYHDYCSIRWIPSTRIHALCQSIRYIFSFASFHSLNFFNFVKVSPFFFLNNTQVLQLKSSMKTTKYLDPLRELWQNGPTRSTWIKWIGFVIWLSNFLGNLSLWWCPTKQCSHITSLSSTCNKLTTQFWCNIWFKLL